MTEGEPPPPKDLDARLRALRERTQKPDGPEDEHDGPSRRAMGLAFRVGVELAAALLVGGGIGWLLDAWFGTSPAMLIVFFFVGAAAGILNVFRAARELMNRDEGGTET
jgi:ATP synthase protein I